MGSSGSVDPKEIAHILDYLDRVAPIVGCMSDAERSLVLTEALNKALDALDRAIWALDVAHDPGVGPVPLSMVVDFRNIHIMLSALCVTAGVRMEDL